MLAAGGRALTAEQERAPLRIRLGISSTMSEGLNENDARAAMKAWANVLLGGSDLELEQHHPCILDSARLCEAIRKGDVDGMVTTIRESTQTAVLVAPDALVVSESALTDEWRYLMLAHADSGIRSLAELKSKGLVLWRNPKTCLGREWLETELHAAGLGPAGQHFSAPEESTKASRGVVLPVFFRQKDCCLAGQSAYEELCELNPQLKAKLRPVAKSPNLVTNSFAFHKGLAERQRRALQERVLTLAMTPAGQQALTLFQTTRLVVGGVPLLNSALQLLHDYERLPRGWGKAR
jgi:ABC-type phosphate/phosphonate transport system substrate-binding protein